MKCDQLMASVTQLPVLAGGGFDDRGRSFHISHRSKDLFYFGSGSFKHLEAFGKLLGMGSLSRIPLQSQTDSRQWSVLFTQWRQSTLHVNWPPHCWGDSPGLQHSSLARYKALQFGKVQSNFGWVFEPCILV